MATLAFVATVATAAAQTVIVVGLPAGGRTTVLLNGSEVGSGSADAMGTATVKFMAVTTGEMGVRLHTESCGGSATILLQGAGQPIGPATACTRQDAGFLFSLRPATTFVVDVAENVARVRVSQGPAPATWLVRGTSLAAIRERAWDLPVHALVLSGGAGLAGLSSITAPHCGDVQGCEQDGMRPVYSAGAAYWLTPWLGVHGSANRAVAASAEGNGTGFSFDASSRLERVNVAAIGGVPAGPARIYGLGGMTYSRTKTKMRESIDAAVSGSPQQIETELRGWGPFFGGGVEIWATPSLAIYGEFTESLLRGADVNGGEARVEGSAPAVTAGMRFRLGR
jgi:hypothetical protein